MRNCLFGVTLCAIGAGWFLAGTSGCRRSQPKPEASSSSNGTSTTEAAAQDIDFADHQDALDAMTMIDRSLSAKDAAELTPAEMVAMLTRLHQVQSRTREWEMLGSVGQRCWQELALRVARRHPQAVRDAIRNGSPIESELLNVLAQVGGKDNALLLARQFRLDPTVGNVIALGHVGDPETFPTLRLAMQMDDLGISHNAGEALVRHGDPQVTTAIARRLRSADPKRRRSALRLAAQAADKRLLETLHDIDGQVDAPDRELLCRAVVSCGSVRYLDRVHELALDESRYLAEIQERSPDPAMRVMVWNYPQNWALDAIERLGSPDSLPTLDRLASEASDPKIRKRAAAIASAIRDRTRMHD